MDVEEYKIKPLKNDNNFIPLRHSMRENIIENYPSNLLFVGKSGAGKTNLLLSLLTRNEFYGNYFHTIIIFSPTAGELDTTYKSLKVPKENIFNEFTPELFSQILQAREAEIKRNGIRATVEENRMAVILDDIVCNRQFLNSADALKMFAMGRHLKIMSFCCTQSYTKINRALRLQINGLYIFPSSQSEVKILKDEITPVRMSKKEFHEVIKDATSGRYDFLHINNFAEPGKRIRKNIIDKYY